MIGLGYLFSGLFVINQILLPASLNIQRILQLPFIITTLAWFGIVLIEPLATEEKKHRIGVAGISIIGILLLVGVLYLHFRGPFSQ